MRRSFLFVVAPVVAALVVAGCSNGSVTDGKAAFTVAGRDTSQQSVDEELELLAENRAFEDFLRQQNGHPELARGEGSINSDVGAGWLSLLIQEDVARREVDRRGVEITKDDRENAKEFAPLTVPGADILNTLPKWFQRRIAERLEPVVALGRELIASGSSELQSALAQTCQSGRYASHILVATLAEAEEISAQLEFGADFATIARERSTDTGSGAQGGYLGCIDGQQYVEPFATAVTTQPLDAVSQPVQTEFGFHLILVTGPPQREVDGVAIALVLSEARKVRVEVDPRYGTWDRANVRVVPPSA